MKSEHRWEPPVLAVQHQPLCHADMAEGSAACPISVYRDAPRGVIRWFIGLCGDCVQMDTQRDVVNVADRSLAQVV
jgi:hypothetical protein